MRAMKNSARLWKDQDEFYLKAALKFVVGDSTSGLKVMGIIGILLLLIFYFSFLHNRTSEPL